MKKSTAILLLSPFVLLFLLIALYSTIYSVDPMPIIEVYNHDNATYEVNIIVNGENNSYVLQSHATITIPKENSKISDYEIEILINDSLQYSDTVNLQKYESLLCSINYGILDTGEVSV